MDIHVVKAQKICMMIEHTSFWIGVIFEGGNRREREMKWVGRWSVFVIFSSIHKRKVEELQ